MESTAERQMIYSGLKTPDGTIIASYHRHDYKTYTDANGKEYMIDGGLDYVRCSAHTDQRHHIVWSDAPFEKVREYFHWGRNYDKDMNLLPETEWVPLAKLTDDHLLALIDGGWGSSVSQGLFNKEKEYRKL